MLPRCLQRNPDDGFGVDALIYSMPLGLCRAPGGYLSVLSVYRYLGFGVSSRTNPGAAQ